MIDKDCSIDQGGSLSIGACDPRFVMMWEWTSMMSVIFRAEGGDRLSSRFAIALDSLVSFKVIGAERCIRVSKM
jgi:hypothetical protein